MYICQICKKAPATIHLTDIHNNVKKEVHICEACASEKGFSLQGAASLPQLLGLAAKKPGAGAAPQGATPPAVKVKTPQEDIVCPKCGMTWSKFSERGRFGCPEDYHAFDVKLRALIGNQIASHLNSKEVLHVGKKPGPRREADELELTIRGLEKRLRQAVAEENYEAAAGLKAELDKARKKKTWK